jgi:NADH:ubiquinone oxidoreductase subunit 6 (subunit J)
MAELLFFIAAIATLVGAAGIIYFDNPFYSVLSLVTHLLSLAALFLLLRSEFLAAAQVVIYAGAVMVLYVFVVAYIGRPEDQLGNPASPHLKLVSIVFAAILFVELTIVLLGSGLSAIGGEGAAVGTGPGFGSPAQVGELLLTRFLLPFEVASVLLLIAAVGAVVLARRRRGLSLGDESATYSAAEFFYPKGTGTMAEAVGSGIPDVRGTPPGNDPKATTDPEVAAGRPGGRSGDEGYGW